MHYSDIIKLQKVPGVGRKSILKLVQELTGLELSSLCFEDYIGLLNEKMNIRCQDADFEKIQIETEKILENCYNEKVGIMTCFDSDYPDNLKSLGIDMPVLLYYKGNRSLLRDASSIAIIGTRKPSNVGLNKAVSYSSLIAGKGYVTVSGLAEGCDTAAHIGAMKVKGRTVAVMPSGIGYVYPPSNKQLYHGIISNNGCVVTEYEPNALPQIYTFVERDRLQAALSKGLLIIESPLAGGTHHTYNYGLKLGKKIAVSNHVSSDENRMSLNKSILGNGKGFAIQSESDMELWLDLLK